MQINLTPNQSTGKLFFGFRIILYFYTVKLISFYKEQAAIFFQGVLDGIGNNFGWLYILAANFFVIVMILFAASKYGNIKIGGPDAMPEFSTFS